MRRWLLAILGLLVLMSGCGRPAEPSIVLLEDPLTTRCNRSVGGRFVSLGGHMFFDMQTRTLRDRPVPLPSLNYSGLWLVDEIMLYYPQTPSGPTPSSSNGYQINPGGFLFDVATEVLTDITTLPQATQDQLRIDGSAAYRREYIVVVSRQSPDGLYWSDFAAISHYDPATRRGGQEITRSSIETVTECTRPWEPDGSGIIFLATPMRFTTTYPGPLRFLPVP